MTASASRTKTSTRAKIATPPPGGDGRQRAVVEAITPSVDGGRFAAKRAEGDAVRVEADVFADGHDAVRAVLMHRRSGAGDWTELAMQPIGNDRWAATFTAGEPGAYELAVSGWVDAFDTWHHDFRKRVEAAQDVAVELEVGALLIDAAASRADGPLAKRLRAHAALLRDTDQRAAIDAVLGSELPDDVREAPDREHETVSTTMPLWVDRRRAVFAAWYERFPRSFVHHGEAERAAGEAAGGHNTLEGFAADLPRIAAMGFDTLYLPPVHPIGTSHRKGRDNTETAQPGDTGSPWAIGAGIGGHTAIHPDLGTLDDFDQLLADAEEHGLELAMDLAYQCSPDHPWVTEHPTWFRHRPDGTIRSAENPPKRYQDIYPIDFESADWPELWQGLKSVVDFWIARGVRTFRVDNPHTKALPFWEWMIGEVHAEHPDVIFLAEAFTAPKLMYRLAKLGFTQSYTYFTWRPDRQGLEEYLTELMSSPVAEYFRPNLWPNTPDILTEQLQNGTRATFTSRLVLAATLSSVYGIYGPQFELLGREPVRAGTEEYRSTEKFEVRHWDADAPQSIAGLITAINHARREHPALQQTRALRFLPSDNPAIIAFLKRVPGDTILVVVNTDGHWAQSGWIDVPLAELGVAYNQRYAMDDLLTGVSYAWEGERNFVQLDPTTGTNAHVFHVRVDG